MRIILNYLQSFLFNFLFLFLFFFKFKYKLVQLFLFLIVLLYYYFLFKFFSIYNKTKIGALFLYCFLNFILFNYNYISNLRNKKN